MKQSLSNLFGEISSCGYARLPGALPRSSTFTETYKAYDIVEELVRRDELVAITLEKSAEAWAKDLRRSSFFARAPIGYRDRSVRTEKAKKSYFQYAPAYGAFVRKKYPHLVSSYPEIDWLFVKCDTVWDFSAKVLKSVILEFDRNFPGVGRLLLRQSGAPVILRLIRYDPGDHIESLPHYDKSAFTVHMHSDDNASDQFVIGRWQPTELRLSDLAPVARGMNFQRPNDAIVFPGLFLSEMGYDEIRPSPHAALGSTETKYRHASVGFWLVPFMFTDHLVTTVPFRSAA